MTDQSTAGPMLNIDTAAPPSINCMNSDFRQTFTMILLFMLVSCNLVRFLFIYLFIYLFLLQTSNLFCWCFNIPR